MLVCPVLRVALLSHFILEKTTQKSGKQAYIPLEGDFPLESGLKLCLRSAISGFREKEWNDCIGNGDFFLRYRFLRCFGDNAPANMKFYYGLFKREGQPIAVCCFQVITLSSQEIASIVKPVSSSGTAPGLTNQWSEWLQRRKKETGMRIMIAGNNFVSGEHAVGIRNAADAREVYLSLAETVKLIVKNDVTPVKISSILIKDFFERKDMPSAVLTRKRYHRFRVEPEMIVEIDPRWKDFDDYLRAMNKKYRARTKNVMKRSASLHRIPADVHYLEENAGRLHELYLNLHNKADFKLSALTPEYFVAMKKRFSNEFSVEAYEWNGQLVAFRSAFRTPDHLEAHFIGIDYQYNAEFNIYQRLLYDYIDEAITLRFKELYLGRTASEMKSSVGAKPHDLLCYIRHRNSFSNQVIRPFIDYIRPSEWTPRNPFG